jgi:hypothetical protein
LSSIISQLHKSSFDNMKRHAAIKLAFHLAALLSMLLLSFPLQLTAAESIDEEPTCKLDQTNSDCTEHQPEKILDGDGAGVANTSISRMLVTLTDENFDELTWTSYPATWLIMFKTDACGICKKALPELEKLVVDPALIEHNENELRSLKDFVYKQGQKAEEGQVPKGPVHIGIIDANWDGRDTTKRFGIDSTPTIIVVRNEGYDDDMDDTRTYTTYRGQRAQYPLKNYVLGGFIYRSKSHVPPPLPARESKPNSLYGRLFEVGKPYLMWVGKLLAAWFIFIGAIGLFMRVHNYAWNDNEEDQAEKAKRKKDEIEREIAEGKREYKIDQSKRAEERQRKMLERKLENRAKFAAKKEERKKKVQPIDGELDDDDDFVAVGVAVKKSDIQKDKKATGKSKSN